VIDVTEIGEVGVVTFDDGKANALSFESLTALSAALEKQAAVSKALVLAGRPDMFSAGLDLSVVKSGDRARFGELLAAGRELYRVLLRSHTPVVGACTGHAVAGGALLLLCCDYRVGLRGDFQIGLPEVKIGVPYPEFGSRVAQVRLNRARYYRATVLGETTGPDEAVEVGFLDEVVDTEVIAAAVTKAQMLTSLAGPAYAAGKRIALSSNAALDDL
jgi:enoyl-CoA hydratase